MTYEEYKERRNQGYTYDQIRSNQGTSSSSTSGSMSYDDYKKLRQQGYSTGDISSGSFMTARTPNSIGLWESTAKEYDDWLKKQGTDYTKWNSDEASKYARQFAGYAKDANRYLGELERSGRKAGDEDYDAAKQAYDYFHGQSLSLVQSNKDYNKYRDQFMFNAGNGTYYSYDQAKEQAEKLRSDVGKVSDREPQLEDYLRNYRGTTAAGRARAQQQYEEAHAAWEKKQQLSSMDSWISQQDEDREWSEFLANNYGQGQNSQYVSDAKNRRLAVTENDLEILQSRQPQRENYAKIDELGNWYDTDEAAYAADHAAWQTEYDQAYSDYLKAQKEANYAESMRFTTAINEANADDAQSIIEKGRQIAQGIQSEAQTDFDEKMGLLMPDDVKYVYMQQSENKASYGELDTSAWTEEKRNTYYYLLGSGKESEAEHFAKLTNEAFNKAQYLAQQNQITAWQDRNGRLGDVAATAAGVAIPMITGIPEYLGAVEEWLATGEISPYRMSPMRASSTMVGNTAGELNERGTIDESIPVLGGKGWGDAYQLGISILQSTLSGRMAMGTGMEGLTLTQFFGSAASSGIFDALEAGKDPTEAVLIGTLNGAAEVLGEKLSLDQIIKTHDTGVARDLLRGMFVQGGIEGSEEAFTKLLNTMADVWVNGDKNDLRIAMNEYISQGMSYEEAQKQAIKDWFNGAGEDFLGGFISGFVSEAGHTAMDNTGTYQKDTRYLMDLADQTAEGSRSREMLQGVQDEFTKNQGRKNQNRQNVSAYRGNQFAAQVQQDLIENNTATAVQAIEQRLTELGETGDVHQKATDMADAIIQELSGDEAGGFAMRPSAQISANATANMRTVMDELQAAREAGVDYGEKNGAWTDQIMKGRFLDQRILNGGREGFIPKLEYEIERSAERRLTQMTDLEQEIQDARKELEGETDTDRKKALNDQIREAENKLKSLQDEVLDDGYESYSEEQKAASVSIDGQNYTVSGMTMAEDGAKVKLTNADGQTTTLEIDDSRLPEAFRSLAVKVKSLDWAAEMAFERYQPGTDINTYVRRIQNIRTYATEKISEEAFMNSKTVQALNDPVLATFLYEQGQSIYKDRMASVQKTQTKIEEVMEKAWNKAGNNTVRTKGEGNVDTTTGADINGKHYDGIDGMKLSKTQSAVVRMVNSLADTLNIDYVIFNGDKSGVQGVYRKGGQIFLNINAGKNVRGSFRALAAETLSHELTHFIEDFAPKEYESLRDAVVQAMFSNDEEKFNKRVERAAANLGADFKGDRQDAAIREVVADACTTALQNSEAVTELARQNMTAAQKIQDFIDETIEKIRTAITEAFAESDPEEYREERKLIAADLDNIQQLWDEGLQQAQQGYNAYQTVSGRSFEAVSEDVRDGNPIMPDEELQFSLARDEEFQEKAEKLNEEKKLVSMKTMRGAMQARKTIRDMFRDPMLAEKLKLPEDVMGNTLLLNSSYGGSEENTTVCVRSLAAQALMDEVATRLGRPLTVQDTLVISQDIMNYIEDPECVYCYVATDRRAYRDFLSRYLEERDAAVRNLESGMDYDEAYKEFLGDRKSTESNKKKTRYGTKDRFAMWQQNAENGTLIEAKDLASLEKLFAEIDELGKTKNRTAEQEARFVQLRDAAQYAQSASWAKKMMGYTAYNNHILNMTQRRVNEFNRHYGLRMYSFSDFSPAFILENMQMITDAAVKGLKVLAYTKEMDFAKIFAPTGANINVSVYASEVNGEIMQDEMMGANWKEAIELRKQYPNVGITLVATNDRIVEWGLNNPDVDVVIPYHLVRTGQAVADFFKFKNYTAVSADGKIKGIDYKGKQTSVYPSEHQNDLIKYVDRLDQLNLTPRFADYLQGLNEYRAGVITEQQFRDMNPNYMKLVNETRQAAQDTKTVQPVFNTEAAVESVNTLAKEGGYTRSLLSYLGRSERSANRVLDKITENVRTAAENRTSVQDQFQLADSKDTEYEAKGRAEALNDLRAENKILQETIEHLQRELTVTKGPRETRLSDAKNLAREIIKETGSSVDVDSLARRIKDVADNLAQTESISGYEYLKSLAVEIARDVVGTANTELDDGTGTEEMRNNFKTAMKGRTIYVPEQYRSDVGDWNDFRKRYFGIFKFSNSGTSIDQVYQALLEEMPGVLDASITNPGDMLNEMAEKWDAMQPVMGNPFEDYWNEAVESYANRIIRSALDGTLRQVDPTYADKMNARIDRLRKEKNARIEEVRKQGIAKKQEAIAKEKAAKWKKVDKTAQYYRDMQARASERRKNTAMRGRIRDMISDINTRLLHGTEKKYVPAELVNATIEILEMIDLDTGRSARIQEKIAKLQQQYAKLKTDETFKQYAYDDTMKAEISALSENIGDTPLHQMSNEQLELVLTTLQDLTHIIRNAVSFKLHGENVNAYEFGKDTEKDTRAAGGISTNSMSKAANKYITSTMRPDVVMDRFGGYAKGNKWVELAEMLNKAQRYGIDLQMAFAKPFEELLKDKKNLAKLTSTKKEDLLDIGLKDENGDVIKVTRDFALMIYMNLFNEDNIRHIMRGGITVPELKEYLSGNGDRGYGVGSRQAVGISQRLSEIDHAIAEATDEEAIEALQEERQQVLDDGEIYVEGIRKAIERQLTDYDKKWVDAWWKFQDLASEAMNKTTLEVYGRKKFQVENYFPIITDKNFLNVPMETIIRDMSLENAGFTKERVSASNPIKLMGLSDVINMQANRTAQYAAIMPAVRAFNKIYNTTLPGYSSSVKSTLSKKFGNDATKFVENLIADLQGGRRTDFTIFDKLRGHMAQATLSLNPRVALAQTASFPTAAAELGWAPVMKALARVAKDGKVDQDLIAKYSSALWARNNGGLDVDMADVKNMQQAAHKVMDKFSWAMNWINLMDSMTVGRLWYAAQYYVDDNFSDLKKGTDEYYMKVAEVFNRTVERTQPNYNVMQRPDILRNPGQLVKALTMFMTQRLQNQSIVYGATAKYLKYRSDLASGKNGVTQADVAEAGRQCARAISSQVAAAATITIFKAFCDALLHRLNGYRDKDKELTAESVSLAMLNNFAESIASNMLGGSEIYTAIQRIITKERYYGISLSGLSTAFETLENIVKFGQNPSWSMAKKLGESVAQYFGIPVENAEKIGMGVWYWLQDARTGDLFKFEAGVERTNAQNAKMLTKAYMSNDQKAIEKYAATFKDEDAMQEAVRDQIKAGYVVQKGQQQTISKEMAIELLIKSGMYKKDARAKVQEWTCEIVTGIPFSKIKDEYMAGNIGVNRVSELLQKYGGRDKESADKTARYYACEKATGYNYNDLKDTYLEGKISKNQLISIYQQYGLMKKSEAENKVTYYEYLKLNPDSDVSQERAVGYMNTVKPTGLSVNEFETALYSVDADKNGSFSQDEVGKYLQGKTYTEAQNEALWTTFGNKWKISFDTWQVKTNADLGGSGKGAANGNVSQEELGNYLVQEIQAGRMTTSQAEKYWSALLTTSKKDFKGWCRSKRINIG